MSIDRKSSFHHVVGVMPSQTFFGSNFGVAVTMHLLQ